MDLYNEEFLKLTRSLEKHQVLYIVVGGFAVVRHGFSRSTGDLDLYLKDTSENRARLVAALEELGYGRLEPLLRAPFIAGYCEVMMDDGMYADLMAELPGLPSQNFDEHYSMAVVAEISSSIVRFLNYNHLIRNKIATGRPKDLEDVRQLELIRNGSGT